MFSCFCDGVVLNQIRYFVKQNPIDLKFFYVCQATIGNMVLPD